ncbi:S-layer homology domain-containing protein [Paenibacillus turicensis]|uniref:S-layer homology domain-containing protein n=1 Tax=Paenibacillus turicensis TaxID=160487 RepID=UPI003D2D3A5E
MEAFTIHKLTTRLIAIITSLLIIVPLVSTTVSANEAGTLKKVWSNGPDSIPNTRTGGIASNGEFVFFFPYGDLVGYKSVDGVNWETVETQLQTADGTLYDGVSDVKQLLWDGKQFVAITSYNVLTSTDATVWKIHPIPHPNPAKEYDLQDIVYTGKQYVLVAQDRSKNASGFSTPGPNTFLVSKDLNIFTAAKKQNIEKSISGERPVEFLATNGTTIYGGGNTSVVSTDGGLSWKGLSSGHSPYSGYGAIWDGKQFVHAIDNLIFTSKDGIKWTSSKISIAGNKAEIKVDNIAYNGSEYIATGYNYNNNKTFTVYTSPDLKKWSKISVATTNTNVIQIKPFRNGFILLGTEAWLYQNDSVNIASSWAQKEVSQAKEHQLVGDSLIGLYRKNITRAEFAEISVRLYEQLTLTQQDLQGNTSNTKADDTAHSTIDNEDKERKEVGSENTEDRIEMTILPSPFSDINNQYVTKAFHLGIVAGNGSKLFNPEQSLQRQDMAIMLNNVLKVAKLTLPDQASQWQKQYKDLDTISGYATEALKSFNATGIIQGIGEQIQPKQSTTREQAIVIAERIYQLLNSSI